MEEAIKPKNIVIVSSRTFSEMETKINGRIDGGYKLLGAIQETRNGNELYATMQLDNTNEMVNDLMKNIKGMKR